MRIWSIIICAAFISGSAAPALAVDWRKAKASPSGKAVHTVYRQPQQLPAFEVFSGGKTKYVHGYRTDFPGGGTTIAQQYDVAEDGSQVLQFYRGMFESNRWQIATVTGDQIVARNPKLGYQCSVDIAPSASQPGYKTGYRINFGMYKPWGGGDDQASATAQNRSPVRATTTGVTQPTLQTTKPKTNGVQTFH